jgi:hypothetical protein
MKKLFAVLSLVMLCGCSDNSVMGTNLDGSVSQGTFSKTKFEGHTYIVYSEGYLDARVGGLAHDPECEKCLKRR